MLSSAEGAAYGANNPRPFYSRRLRARPVEQPIGDNFTLGGRGRNLWRNQSEAVYFRRPRAQLMAQPIGDILILGGPVRNLWRNQ